MTQHVNHRHSDEIAKLNVEIERLTRERKMTLIQFEETVARLADDKAHFKARAEAAERKLQQRADELNVLQGSIAAYQSGELERKLAMAVEAFNSGIGEIETIGNALHNDGFVYANNAWRVVALFRATLAALEKADG